MGKSWKNPLKSANAAKKGAIITKLAREIQVAAKMGGPDPGYNARLRGAIDAAKAQSCPNDTIERAIKKGSGQLEGEQIDEISYEGYAPHGVGVILECQTNNKNRTASEVRQLFKGGNGNLGESGSVAWMFDRVCLLEAKKEGSFDPEEEAIEVNANEVSKADEGYHFFGAPENLAEIRDALTKRGWKVTMAEMSYKPKNKADITEEQKKEVIDFLNELDDFEDTHRVHSTLVLD